jgi:transcriptional regulator with XRE-family HTH domain
MLTSGMKSQKTLGERIRELREEQDLSLREFAKKLDETSPAHISDIENNRRFPSPQLLKRMAHLLDTDVTELGKYDVRPPMGDLRRSAQKDPAMGLALRKLADKEVSPQDILDLAKRNRDRETK